MAQTRTLRAVVACMRNEGQFLLEWVAYHRSIGFDRVFVVTNDCSDGTDAMLDRLAQIEPVTHIRNQIGPGEPPQVAGLRLAMAHPDMADVAWLLHCDADEFLNVTAGQGRVDDLLAAVGDCDAIALLWRLMGSGGRKLWTHDSVIASQTLSAPAFRGDVYTHKTMFRPDRFGGAIDNMPKLPLAPDVVLKNAVGEVMNPRSFSIPHHGRYRRIDQAQLTWQNADIHHYAIRSEDVFVLKNVRGDGMAIASPKYFVGSVFWRRAERNEVEECGIQRHLPALRARLRDYHADPVLDALDAAAFAWFVAIRETYLTDENLAAWTKTQDDAAAE